MYGEPITLGVFLKGRCNGDPGTLSRSQRAKFQRLLTAAVNKAAFKLREARKGLDSSQHHFEVYFWYEAVAISS